MCSAALARPARRPSSGYLVAVPGRKELTEWTADELRTPMEIADAGRAEEDARLEAELDELLARAPVVDEYGNRLDELGRHLCPRTLRLSTVDQLQPSPASAATSSRRCSWLERYATASASGPGQACRPALADHLAHMVNAATFVPLAELRERGWTPGLVRRRFGAPDRPPDLYAVHRVAAVEADPGFARALDLARRRAAAARRTNAARAARAHERAARLRDDLGAPLDVLLAELPAPRR